MRKSVIAALLLLVVSAAPAFAWNDEGHMAAAYVAYDRLQPAVRRRVDLLLQRNLDYFKWLAALPAGLSKYEANRMLFMIAATWPDQIKGDPAYTDDGSYRGNIPGGPDSSRNIGYSDRLRHRYWHFIDLFFSPDGTPLPRVPVPNAQTQIAAFRAVLHSDASDGLKSYDLVWLEHLVGDVHQPLHAAARVTKYLPEGDAGGNLVFLCAMPCGNTLHSFWDRLIGDEASIEPRRGPRLTLSDELQSATVAVQALPAPDAGRAADLSEAAWVRESFELAKQRVYVPPIGPAVGPFTITPEYFASAKDLAAEQVALAGARLANLLNAEIQ